MATPKLTPEQQRINGLLQEMGYYTYKYDDFSKDPIAVELLEKYIQKDLSFLSDVKLFMFISRNLQGRKIPESPINMDTVEDKKATQILFGLTNDALIQKVMHIEYGVHCTQDTETGDYWFDNKLQKKVDGWVQYCRITDRCYQQYRADESIWNKSAQDKKQYKQRWKKLAQAPLISRDPDNIIHNYCEFLNMNYGLNQKIKVKADYLLSLGLPNISKFSIAKKIVETSSLLR